MSTLPDISVVVCAYTEERWEPLVAAIDSLRRQTRPPREVIVVIDHNPPLLERARTQFPDAVVLENREPRGLSGARNSGIAAARGEVVAFLDEDAAAAEGWLEQLAAAYADPEVAGVGGAIEPVWLAGRPHWFPEEFFWTLGCTYRGMPETRAPVRNLIGCNMSFRRALFAEVGGFRSGIGRVGAVPFGCEETELCIRVGRRRGAAAILFEPAARVRHRVPAARASWRYFSARCYAEGISKAQVAGLVGAGDGLSAERRHVLRTLPRGVVLAVGEAVRARRPGPLLRAGAIVAGLLLTVAGFARASLPRGLLAVHPAAGLPATGESR